MAHRHGMTGRMLAMALAMIMIVTSLPQTAMTAYAAENVDIAAENPDGAAADTTNEVVDQSAPENEAGGLDIPASEEENNASVEDEIVPADEVVDPADGGSTPADEGNNYAQNEEEVSSDEAASTEEDASVEVDSEDAFDEMERPVDPNRINAVTLKKLEDREATLNVSATFGGATGTKYVALFYREVKETPGTYIQIGGSWSNSSTGAGVNGNTDFTIPGLTPETAYEYKVYMSKAPITGTEPAATDVIESYSGSFTTKSFMPLKSLKEVVPGVKSAYMEIDQVEFDFSYTGRVYYYVRSRLMPSSSDAEWGDESWEDLANVYYNESTESQYYGTSNSYSTTLYDLEPEKTYQYQIVASRSSNSSAIGDYEKKVALTGSFTTLKEITIGDITVDPGARKAVIKVPVTGGEGEKYVNVFYKKEASYVKAGQASTLKASDVVEVGCTGLEPNTPYDCIAVVTEGSYLDEYNPDATTYPGKKAVEQFSTKEDKREISAKAEVVCRSVNFTVDFKGGTEIDETPLAIYYREKKSTSPDKYKYLYSKIFEKSAEGTWEYSSRALDEGKDYEYVVILWKDSNTSYHYNYYTKTYDPDDKEQAKDIVKITTAAEFKTKEDGRAIGEVAVTPAYASAKFEVPVSGNVDKISTNVYVYWREKKEGESWSYSRMLNGYWPANRVDYTVTEYYDSGNEEYYELRATGLKPKTTYEYAVVLTDGSGYISDETVLDSNDATVQKAAGIIKMVKKEFTTLEAGSACKLTTPEVKSTVYDSATITAGYTGGVKGDELKLTVFYKTEDGADAYTTSYYSSTEEVYSTNCNANEVFKTGKQYDAAVVLATTWISTYPVSDSDKAYVIDSKEFKIETSETRKLTDPVVTPGYTSLTIQAGYEGNNQDTGVYVAYYLKKGDSYTRVYSYDYGNDSRKSFASREIGTGELEPGKSYDCAVVLSDKSSFASSMTSTEMNEIREGWKVVKTCSTKKADLTPKVEYDKDGSSVGYNVLNVSVEGTLDGGENSIIAELTIKEVGSDDSLGSIVRDDEGDLLRVMLKSDGSGYSGTLIDDKGLFKPNTKYAVTQVEFKDRELHRILLKKGTDTEPKMFVFTTNAGEIKVTLPEKSDEIYLVKDNAVTITADVTPASAAKAADTLFTFVKDSDPASKGDVTPRVSFSGNNGKINIELEGNLAGDATYKLISKADLGKAPADQTALATIKVHVKNYFIAYVPKEGTPATPIVGKIKLQKGVERNVAIYEVQSDATVKVVEETVTVEEGVKAVTWDGKGSASKMKAENAGIWDIKLKIGDNYYMYVTVDAMTALYEGFIIKELRNESYPGIMTPDKSAITATVAAGKQYMIDGYVSPINTILSDVTDLFEFSVTKDADGRVKMDAGNTGIIYTAASDKAYEAEVTVKTKEPVEGETRWAKTQTTVITLKVLPIPEIPESMGYVLSNVAKTLGDVKLDAKYEGWSWDDAASTPLFDSAAAPNAPRSFKVSYKADDKYYPLSGQEVKLSVCTMNNFWVNRINTVNNAKAAYDVATLKDGKVTVKFQLSNTGYVRVSPSYGKLIGESQYQYVLECTDRKAGITPTKTSDWVAEAEFTKVGTYNFVAKILNKSGDTVILSNKYKIKVVETPQISTIRIKSATYNDEAKTDITDRLRYSLGSSSNGYSVGVKEEADKGVILTMETLGSGNVVIDDSITKLTWKSSDTKVAKIKVEKKNTRVITITPGKEQGHAVITATAKDAAGKTYTFSYEYQNKEPRVDKKSLKVNLIYDTDTDAGRDYAYNYGSWVEIVPVYGEPIKSVKLYEKSGKAAWSKESSVAAEFGVARYAPGYANDYLITATAKAKTGKNNLWLVVTTKSGSYPYPLTVTVAAKNPSVKAKVNGKINYFYVDKRQANITVTVGDKLIDDPTVSWKDQSDTPYGFVVSNTKDTLIKKGNTWVWDAYSISDSNIRVENGRLTDANIVKGTLTVTLPGIRKDFGAVVEKTLKIPAVYKKPVLATDSASTNFVSKAKVFGNSFVIYNKTESKGKAKSTVYYRNGASQSWMDSDTITTTTDSVVLRPRTYTSNGTDYSYVAYIYNGSKKSEKIMMTVDSRYWREPLQVKHTIKDIAPKAVLSCSKITTNSTLDDLFIGYQGIHDDNVGNLYISLKGSTAIALTDVEVEGIKGAADLVKNNLIEVGINEAAYVDKAPANACIRFRQNALSALGGSLKKGTYKFKFTAHYLTADGEDETLNPVTLSIKVVDKKMTAKTSVSGKLDIAKESFYGYKKVGGKTKVFTTNVVKLNPKLANLPSSVNPKDAYYVQPVLEGQYANSFSLVQAGDSKWYIGFSGFGAETRREGTVTYDGQFSSNSSLKAGMTIPLKIKYKVYVMGADEITSYAAGVDNRNGKPNKRLAEVLDGGTIKIKAVQSKPKVKITYNKGHELLYAGAGNGNVFSRRITMKAPVNCQIDSVYGYLDCNKDGTYDVEVRYNAAAAGVEVTPRVYLNNTYGVAASKSGKTLTIPCTVRVVGADGISQDVKVNVKVKVKR